MPRKSAKPLHVHFISYHGPRISIRLSFIFFRPTKNPQLAPVSLMRRRILALHPNSSQLLQRTERPTCWILIGEVPRRIDSCDSARPDPIIDPSNPRVSQLSVLVRATPKSQESGVLWETNSIDLKRKMKCESERTPFRTGTI